MPGQYPAIEITELTAAIYDEGSTLTIWWAPRHQEVTGDEVSDVYAKKAAGARSPGKGSHKAMELISAPFLEAA